MAANRYSFYSIYMYRNEQISAKFYFWEKRVTICRLISALQFRCRMDGQIPHDFLQSPYQSGCTHTWLDGYWFTYYKQTKPITRLHPISIPNHKSLPREASWCWHASPCSSLNEDTLVSTYQERKCGQPESRKQADASHHATDANNIVSDMTEMMYAIWKNLGVNMNVYAQEKWFVIHVQMWLFLLDWDTLLIILLGQVHLPFIYIYSMVLLKKNHRQR